jgi:hypothetical protein
MKPELPPVPLRMLARPCDERGYPIPYAQFINKQGKPDFRILDAARVQLCLSRRLCGLCGEPMGKHVHFIGGPLCVANRIFHDPPMHRDCAVFALQACTHLAHGKGRYSERPLPEEEGAVVVENAYASAEKAEWFALMHTTKFYQVRMPNGSLAIKADAWLDVEAWRDGKPIKKKHVFEPKR